MKCRVVIVLISKIISLRCMPVTSNKNRKQVTSNTYALETRIL
jgi:hypothetical protein